MTTELELQQWVSNIGFEHPTLGLCIGTVFADSHGGRLPDRTELCSWLPGTGIIKPDGTWSCTMPVGNTGLQLGLQNIWSALQGSWEYYIPKVRAWIWQHPPEAALVGVGIYWMLMQQSVHPWTRPMYRERQKIARSRYYKEEAGYG